MCYRFTPVPDSVLARAAASGSVNSAVSEQEQVRHAVKRVNADSGCCFIFQFILQSIKRRANRWRDWKKVEAEFK